MSNNLPISEKDHRMPISKAAVWTKQYRENHTLILRPAYDGKDVLPICETFNKDSIQALFNLPDCQGLRIYYGMDPETYRIHAVLCGSNSNGEDLYLHSLGADNLKDSEGYVLEDSNRCPPLCPPDSPLNS